MQTIELPIRGMTCGSCVATIERAVGRVPGVQAASVNLAAAEATITYDPAVAQVNHLIQAIEDAGYAVKAVRGIGGNEEMANQSSTTHTLKQVLKMGACCAGPILGLALLAPLASSLGVGISSIFSFLLVLACPLGMLLMMYFMNRGMGGRQGQGKSQEQPRPRATPGDAAIAAAEGNGRPEPREVLPLPEEPQALLASEGVPTQAKRSRAAGV
ncbi:MAG: heavy-metal-associated domain-containing protein [Candidatus Entotheonellia bacterium]